MEDEVRKKKTSLNNLIFSYVLLLTVRKPDYFFRNEESWSPMFTS